MDGPAWSTAKVPLAVAVSRADGGSPSDLDSSLMRAALTMSDNEAALALWERLGGGARSASAVKSVLADAGDAHTEVPATPRRAGFSVIGQTHWSLADQAGFALELDSLSGSTAAVADMASITPSQRWGLGHLDGTRIFKGGWGPTTGSGYLVRQFGQVTTSSGTTFGVAVAAESTDGFVAAVARLNSMVAAIPDALATLPPNC